MYGLERQKICSPGGAGSPGSAFVTAATTVATSLQSPHSRRRNGSNSSINFHLPLATGLQWRHCLITGPSLHLEKGRESVFAARGRRSRNGMVMGDYGDYIEEDDDEDEEEGEDRSLDLLIRFVENIFRNVSRRARKAVKSVLPVPISTRLVGFAVNGTLFLTFLWVLKAFLEVICALGSVVFVSILFIRGMWTGISYFHETRSYRGDDDEPQSWSSAQPAI